jgi:hypothetical protein
MPEGELLVLSFRKSERQRQRKTKRKNQPK